MKTLVAAPIDHIGVDERGVAYIKGTRMKVRQIAIDRIVWRESPEEIQESYSHLTLAQVYAALAYYYDHKEQVDAEIEEADRFADEMRAKHPNRLTREELERRLREREESKPPV
jgi:uncharacterized protein (DUF433 family)